MFRSANGIRKFHAKFERGRGEKEPRRDSKTSAPRFKLETSRRVVPIPRVSPSALPSPPRAGKRCQSAGQRVSSIGAGMKVRSVWTRSNSFATYSLQKNVVNEVKQSQKALLIALTYPERKPTQGLRSKACHFYTFRTILSVVFCFVFFPQRSPQQAWCLVQKPPLI